MAQALYLHVPFCDKICFYCDFKRSVYQHEKVEMWLNAICKELDSRDISKQLKTIYIGGGTPTSLSVEQLTKLLEHIKPYISKVEEFSVESNIESINEEKLLLLKKYGVNRISLGIQSYDDMLLEEMNRMHRFIDIDQTIEMISKVISNITIDLIYGFQKQTLGIWMESLRKATNNKNIKHISIYSLTIEEDSVFGKQKVKLIDNEVEAQMYDEAIKYLNSQGFQQYEIANFTREGYESKHNQFYWRYDDFYGVGLGASGKENHVRYSIEGTLQQYIEHQPTVIEEQLSQKDEIFEYLMMNLRMKKGIDINHFKCCWKIDFLSLFQNIIDEYINKQYFIYEYPNVRTTKQGMFCLHDILVTFMEVLDERSDIA